MTKVKMYKQDGSSVGEIELNDQIFAIEPNNFVITDAVLMQRASLRQGTHSTKNRGEVSGGGRKPWKQKGTGRARQGSIRAPQWRGGGIIGGPTPRDYSYHMNKKQYRLALKSVLSQKVLDNKLVIVDEFKFEKPSTKDFISSLSALNINTKFLAVTENGNINAKKSIRNIEKSNVIDANGINVLDIMKSDVLLLTQSAVKQIEEVLS